MCVRDEFDYAGMAEQTSAVLKRLEAGLERVRAVPVRGMEDQIRQNTRINLLEEEILEQKALLRLFLQRARERGQST